MCQANNIKAVRRDLSDWMLPDEEAEKTGGWIYEGEVGRKEPS